MKKRTKKNVIPRASLTDNREQRVESRKRVRKEIDSDQKSQEKEQGTDVESSKLYGHFVNLISLSF